MTLVLAANIKTLMEARGLTPAALRRAAGINQSGIHDILTGRSRSPKVDTVAKIAKALGVSPADLFLEPSQLAARAKVLNLMDRMPPEMQDLFVRTAEAWVAETEDPQPDE